MGLSVTIVGCGAVGLFYGALLHKARLNVRFLARSDFKFLRDHGLRVESSIFGNWTDKIQVFSRPEECASSDLILVCLKTTARDYLKTVLPKLLVKNTTVMTLQNGLGNEEFVSAFVDTSRIIGGVAFVCLNRVSPGVVSHTAFGHIKVGLFGEGDRTLLEELQCAFESVNLKMIVTESLLRVKWEKLIWNIPFNGLSAVLGGVDTEQILKHPPTRQLVEELMKEVVVAAKSDGVTLEESLIRDNIDKTLPMGPYKTSMCLDRLKGNPLEVETILAEPLRRGQSQGVSLPHLQSLYSTLSFYNRRFQV